ncbi:MAG: PstS family phosphate ABC transporter substrate-binding protein [Pseudonocardia sp.]
MNPHLKGLVALAAALVALTGCGGPTAPDAAAAGPLKVSGSTTVNPVAADAAAVLRERTGQEITVDTQGGSAGGLAQLCAGEIQLAMSSKPVADSDRQKFPDCDYRPTQIGSDAVGIIVRRDVYDGGVRALTAAQARDLFEGRVQNWSAIGGPDLPVFVYDKEPGRGTREQLDKFLYGTAAAPPPPDVDNFAIVGGNEETRTKMLSTPGSVGPLSTSFVVGYPELVAVAIDGVEPTPATIAEGTYPMARPLYLVTDGPAQGRAAEFVDFVLGAEGQQLVTRHGYLTLAQLGTAP